MSPSPHNYMIFNVTTTSRAKFLIRRAVACQIACTPSTHKLSQHWTSCIPFLDTRRKSISYCRIEESVLDFLAFLHSHSAPCIFFFHFILLFILCFIICCQIIFFVFYFILYFHFSHFLFLFSFFMFIICLFILNSWTYFTLSFVLFKCRANSDRGLFLSCASRGASCVRCLLFSPFARTCFIGPFSRSDLGVPFWFGFANSYLDES